jgi:hypothetical protein
MLHPRSIYVQSCLILLDLSCHEQHLVCVAFAILLVALFVPVVLVHHCEISVFKLISNFLYHSFLEFCPVRFFHYFVVVQAVYLDLTFLPCI